MAALNTAAILHSPTGPFLPTSLPLRPSCLPYEVLLCESGVCSSQERATEQCVTVSSACHFSLVPAHLATSQELGLEQHGSQARGLMAVGTQIRRLELLLGSQGAA